MLLLLWVACSSPGNVELRAQRRALDAWEEGRAALDAERPDDARGAFDRALKERPGDLILLAWRAQAEAAAGDLAAAVATLDLVLDAEPDFAEARYHRAAYLARAGRPEEAGPDLRRALEDGAGVPLQVLKDPDFRPYRSHDAFSYLPASALLVAAKPLPDRAFRGSEVPVEITVAALTDPDALAVEGLVHGPVDLRRSVEDRTPGPDGTTVALRWDLVLTGAGPVVVGPLSFRLDGEQHTESAHTVQSVVPGARSPDPERRWRLGSATGLGEGLELDQPVRRGERVFVRTEVTAQVATTPEDQVLARHERRTNGQPDWVVWELGPVSRVVVRGVGGERFAGPPTDAPSPR